MPIAELFDAAAERGWCYLCTVSDDGRPHLVALRPATVGTGEARRFRFDAGTGRAARNAAARPQITLVFPPAADSDGFSLVVDGTAERADTAADAFVDVLPTWAVLHRPAP